MKIPNYGWSYPPGAEYDPSAPYNQRDDEYKVCPDCDGTEYESTICSHCGIEITKEIDDMQRFAPEDEGCPSCRHDPELVVCKTCSGDGVVAMDEDDLADDKELRKYGNYENY